MRRLTASEIHTQALLGAALIAAEVRDEAEEGVGTLRYRNDYYLQGYYEAANTIAQRLVDLATNGATGETPWKPPPTE